MERAPGRFTVRRRLEHLTFGMAGRHSLTANPTLQGAASGACASTQQVRLTGSSRDRPRAFLRTAEVLFIFHSTFGAENITLLYLSFFVPTWNETQF